MAAETEDRDWQRLDTWLWYARVAKTRAACTRMVVAGSVRVNRQPTDKPHFKLRLGDVLTFALGGPDRGVVRIWRVVALGDRRGPAPEARALFQDIGASPAA